MKVLSRFMLFLVIGVAIIGCGKKDGEPTASPIEPTAVESESPLSPLAVPAAVDSPLPPSNEGRFSLDKPIHPGSTEVSGHGPADVPLQVVDITAGGEILGSGVIDAEGDFRIALGIPIEPNRAIGIQLATGKDPDTWLSLWALRGEGARAIPQIGDFFDSAVSEPE